MLVSHLNDMIISNNDFTNLQLYSNDSKLHPIKIYKISFIMCDFAHLYRNGHFNVSVILFNYTIKMNIVVKL